MVDVRVLVVDDQEPFRDAATAVIEATGGFILVASVTDGAAAIAAIEEHRPDLVLMDVHLPDMDGLEATRRITTAGDAPLVVLVSTYAFGDLGEDALACGAGAYIAKVDFDSDSLRGAWALVRG